LPRLSLASPGPPPRRAHHYLDLDSVHWLQDFLNNYDGTLIAISHDRHFLNSVTTHRRHRYETIITYTGGYDEMVMAKTQIRSTLESQNAQRDKKIASSTTSSPASRRNPFLAGHQPPQRGRAPPTKRPRPLQYRPPYIRFDQNRPSGKHVLEFSTSLKIYGDHTVIDGFTANVLRGEHICLMGRNGAGKTTLLKCLLSTYPGLADPDFTLDSGSATWGHEAQIGYFPQDVGATLISSETAHGLSIAEWLHRWKPDAHVEDIRGILGQMLFSGEEGDKQTKALSGGEQARLAFCKLILTKPNILIFDEPTTT